jgi:hypothetical protein
MFWLVRAAPAHMLRLQAGRFDAPDRLFCSVGEAWEGVSGTNPADVKELIPEFYLRCGATAGRWRLAWEAWAELQQCSRPQPRGGGNQTHAPPPGLAPWADLPTRLLADPSLPLPRRHDFLLNARGLALGTRQSGRPVGDVELPPWAASAPHFLSVLRAALEAPFVSANLHSWVDLVFGHLQRGQAAVEADNVFRHTAYEGGVDIEAVADPTERAALEMQVGAGG